MTPSENPPPRDALIQRAAEALKDHGRAERLGDALVGLARELADARRQIALLRRENAELRTQLERDGQEQCTAIGDGRPPDRLATWAGIGDRQRE